MSNHKKRRKKRKRQSQRRTTSVTAEQMLEVLQTRARSDKRIAALLESVTWEAAARVLQATLDQVEQEAATAAEKADKKRDADETVDPDKLIEEMDAELAELLEDAAGDE